MVAETAPEMGITSIQELLLITMSRKFTQEWLREPKAVKYSAFSSGITGVTQIDGSFYPLKLTENYPGREDSNAPANGYILQIFREGFKTKAEAQAALENTLYANRKTMITCTLLNEGESGLILLPEELAANLEIAVGVATMSDNIPLRTIPLGNIVIQGKRVEKIPEPLLKYLALDWLQVDPEQIPTDNIEN